MVMSSPSFPRHGVYFRSVVVGNLAPSGHTQASCLSEYADGRKCLLRSATEVVGFSKVDYGQPRLSISIFRHCCDETAIRMRCTFDHVRLFLGIRDENVCSSRYTKWYLTPTKDSSIVQRFVSQHIYVKYEMPRDHRHSFPLQNLRKQFGMEFS